VFTFGFFSFLAKWLSCLELSDFGPHMELRKDIRDCARLCDLNFPHAGNLLTEMRMSEQGCYYASPKLRIDFETTCLLPSKKKM
jgi:hypothetical protein